MVFLVLIDTLYCSLWIICILLLIFFSFSSGLIPIPIELVADTSNDQLCSNLDALEIALKNPAKYLLDHWPDAAQAYNVDDKSIENSTSDDIVCIFTTTNCFAPRVPDK